VPQAEKSVVLEPKILKEDTMTEMEVEETGRSSYREKDGGALRLEDLGAAKPTTVLTPTNQHNLYSTNSLAPLGQNYLKYCQNFKPKKQRQRKKSSRENSLVTTGKPYESHTGSQALKASNGRQSKSFTQSFRRPYQH